MSFLVVVVVVVVITPLKRIVFVGIVVVEEGTTLHKIRIHNSMSKEKAITIAVWVVETAGCVQGTKPGRRPFAPEM